MGNSQVKEVKKQMTILLLGTTGHGKSATGNSILGRRRAFEVSPSTDSMTREVASSYNKFDNYTLKVVDGPGLADANINTNAEDLECALKNMEKAITLCSEDVDAFVFVLRYGARFKRDDLFALQSLKHIFGEQFLQHVIIVMTGGDLFVQDFKKTNFKSWCRKQKGEFEILFNDCKERCVLFDNKGKDEEKMKAQRKELVDLVGTLNGRYTSECFSLARAARDRIILELKAPQLRETIQKKISLITADIDKLIDNPSSRNVEKIGKRIKSLKDEIQIQDKGFGVLDDLQDTLTEVTKNFNYRHELPRLREKLERWRKAQSIWETISSSPVALSILTLVPGGIVVRAVIAAGVAVTNAAIEIAKLVCTLEADSAENNIRTMTN